MPNLSGCTIVADGKWRADFTPDNMKKWIERRQGKLAKAVDETTTHLVVTQEHWDKKSKQVQEALKRVENGQTIRIVSFDWLERSFEQGGRRSETKYSWMNRDKGKLRAQEEKGRPIRDDNATLFADVVGEETYEALNAGMKQQKATKNKSAGLRTDAREQDEESAKFFSGLLNKEPAALLSKKSEQIVNDMLRSRYHVYKDETGFIFNVTIAKIDCLKNKNRRETFTIYESNAEPRTYALIVRSSGTDDTPNTRLLVSLGAVWQTVWRQFEENFESKTGSLWEQRFELAKERERRKRMPKIAPTADPSGFVWNEKLFRVNDLDHSFSQYQPPKFGPGNEESVKAAAENGIPKTADGTTQTPLDVEPSFMAGTMSDAGLKAFIATMGCDRPGAGSMSVPEESERFPQESEIPADHLRESIQRSSDNTSGQSGSGQVNVENRSESEESLAGGDDSNGRGEVHQQVPNLEITHSTVETQGVVSNESIHDLDDQDLRTKAHPSGDHANGTDAGLDKRGGQNRLTHTAGSHEAQKSPDQAKGAGSSVQKADVSLTKKEKITRSTQEEVPNCTNKHAEKAVRISDAQPESDRTRAKTKPKSGGDQRGPESTQRDVIVVEGAEPMRSNKDKDHEGTEKTSSGVGKDTNGRSRNEQEVASLSSAEDASTTSTKGNDPQKGKGANDRVSKDPETSGPVKEGHHSAPEIGEATAALPETMTINDASAKAGLHEAEEAIGERSEILHSGNADEHAGSNDLDEQNATDTGKGPPEKASIELVEGDGRHQAESTSQGMQLSQVDKRAGEDVLDASDNMQVDATLPTKARIDSPVKETATQVAEVTSDSVAAQPAIPKAKRSGEDDLLESKAKKVKVNDKSESTEMKGSETEQSSATASATGPLVDSEKEVPMAAAVLPVNEEETVASDAVGN